MTGQFIVDVIGSVVEIYSPVEKVIAGKLSRLIDFVLEDTSQRQVKCTLCDDHVDELSPYFNSVVANPLILLIQLCWAKIMDNGEVRIYSSFDGTQLFFNHSCKEFRDLRNSYNTKLTPLQCIQSGSRLWGANMDFSQGSNDLVVTQIEEIYSKKKLGEYWVAGHIVDVESVVDCSWQEGVVRYKVIVRVADDTGDVPMLIWDRECSDLVGVSASDLLAKYPEGNRGIPPELGCLRGLSMLFRILMKKDQAESYYSAFTVLSICRDEGVLTQHCSNLLGGSERDGISGDGHCVSGEDCVAVEEVSQCSGLEKVTGLEDFEEGFGVDGADVTLKRSLLKDFDRCGSSKKSKGIVVKEEK
nr:replication protein A 70 kDa DNA-binding subunit B-like [Ipomoea batatas]